MRNLQKIEALAGETEWDLAQAFVQRSLWPYLVEHNPESRFDAHYHRTDEELQVLRGSMTFVDVRTGPDDRIELRARERLRIPEGTVHAVQTGAEGVAYVMGLARPVPPEQFAVYLPVSHDVPLAALADLIETNYRIAEAEEIGQDAKSFFDNVLSERLVFVGAAGDQSMRKEDFIKGLEGRKGRGRQSTGLRVRREGDALVASIVVRTGDGGEYLNTRLFEKHEDGRWRCVRWTNARAKSPNPNPR
jgi:ketosteroid isomerase-like protein